MDDLLEADLWPEMTSGLPVTRAQPRFPSLALRFLLLCVNCG
jgi:hypothetical protein